MIFADIAERAHALGPMQRPGDANVLVLIEELADLMGRFEHNVARQIALDHMEAPSPKMGKDGPGEMRNWEMALMERTRYALESLRTEPTYPKTSLW